MGERKRERRFNRYNNFLYLPTLYAEALCLIWRRRDVPNNSAAMLRAPRRNKNIPTQDSHRERSTGPQRHLDVGPAIPAAVLSMRSDEEVRALRDVFRGHGLYGQRVATAAAAVRPGALVLPRRGQEPANILTGMLRLFVALSRRAGKGIGCSMARV